MSGSLVTYLERAAALYDKKEKLSSELSEVNKEIKEVERIAVETLAASGLDGVKAAGKSWGIRDSWNVSIPADRKEEAVRIAEENGLSGFVAVNTASLKSWLVEQRKKTKNGTGSDSLAAGTPFEGLVSEYHQKRLTHLTRGDS